MATATAIHGYGLLSARPAAATATAGNEYFATDTGYNYRDNGTTWDVIGTTNPMTTAQDLIRGGASGAPTRLAVGSNGNVLTVVAGVLTWQAPATSGTVTSVALTVPTGLTVAGSPVTSSGTLAISESTQSANIVKAGPTSGGAATPAYRALVAADLPAATTTAVGALKSPFLFASTADGTVANTTTETSLVGTGVGTLTLPANALVAGRSIRITASGYIEWGNANATELLTFYMGATPIIVVSADIGGVSATQYPWEATFKATCRTTGVSGTVMPRALFLMLGGNVYVDGPVGTQAAVTINTTTTQALDLKWTWDGADPGNIITCTNAIFELVGI